MRILIDGRFWGLENAGLGRYTINLVEELGKIDKQSLAGSAGNKNQYLLLLRKKYFNRLKLPANWTQVLADFPHYSLQEQLALPRLISSFKPDLVHFLHFNVPIFYPGPYVVTIHDLLMHKQRGLAATTLPAAKYFLKRLGYKAVFASAVKKAGKIIVPSNTVKRQLLNFYQIKSEKVVVIYEGV